MQRAGAREDVVAHPPHPVITGGRRPRSGEEVFGAAGDGEGVVGGEPEGL